MAVTLTVSQVRQELQRAGGFSPGDGQSSSAVVGTLFHRVAAELLRPESDCSIESILRDVDPILDDWKARLKSHAYDQLVGPLLTQQAGVLQGQGRQVLNLWQAVQSACDWFAELWWEFTKGGKNATDQRVWIGSEQPLIRELSHAGWREPVALVGQADAVLQIPSRSAYCVVEWKLGQTSPELDLAQAALYYLLLHRDKGVGLGNAIAVMSFKPERCEFTVDGGRLRQAQDDLTALIGRMAGVVETASVAERKVLTHAPAGAGALAGEMKAISPQPASKPTSPAELPSWVAERRTALLRILRQAGVPCRDVDRPVVGPAFARFFVLPDRGISVAKVRNQAEQLYLHLALPSPPNMTVVEGKIGIDLPRPDRVTVSYADARPHLGAGNAVVGSSQVPVGVDLNGQWQSLNLASSESAHALVVGTPGSGKSQWLRVAVAALMERNTPQTLKLMLIDPKQNAFGFARSSPFLLRPLVIPGNEEAPISETLNELTTEMVRRNGVLASSNSQNLTEHVRKTGQSIPRIVCVCDEYADLLDGSDKNERKAIEHEFKRIAQVGRAAGIHLILATQQPRTTVITSAIRSLIPAKVCLRVSSAQESRVALECGGAERLLGNGDLLYKCIGEPIRLQGAWLPENQEPSNPIAVSQR